MVALTTLTLWSLGQSIVGGAGGREAPSRRSRRARPVSAGRAATATPAWPRRRLGTQSVIGRTLAISSAMSGASASAAAIAVSIAVRHSTPSAIAAWRMSAASRTAPERGVGVLTTSRTWPSAMSSRIAGLARAPGSAPSFATGAASNPAASERGAGPGRRRQPVARDVERPREVEQAPLVAVGDREQRERRLALAPAAAGSATRP